MASTGRKFFDVAVPRTVVGTTGDMLPLAEPSVVLIPQGAGSSQRVGRRVTIRRIEWRFTAAMASKAIPTSDMLRFILFVDGQTNCTAPANLDLLEIADVLSFPNVSNLHRFTILVDEQLSFEHRSGSGNGTTDLYGEVRQIGRIELDVNVPIEYSANNQTMGDVCSNSIGVLVISDEGAVSFFSQMRLWYDD